MTEDEVFIRAIVDSPGDDLPRLVYADWLDDHDDPRGTYLRTEVEWAKPWRDGKRPGESSDLRELAAWLDPVWVACVSRPPVGVYCNRSKFDSPGPPLSDQDLERFETAVGLSITGEYRAFLLTINGGILPNKGPRPAGGNWSPPHECFYSLNPDGRIPEHRSLLHHANQFRSQLSELLSIELWDAGADDVHWQADALPIGGDNSYFTLFYAVRGKYAGRLHLHDVTGDWCAFGWIAGPHGPPTLPEFLHRLIEYDQGLADTYPSQPLQEFWKS